MAEEPNEGPSGESMTARERRAQRVKSQGRRDAPKKLGKTAAFVVLAILVIAGGVWAIQKVPKGRGTGHEHSVFRVFNNGQEVSFDAPQFDFSVTQYPNAHLHHTGPEAGNSKYVIHAEGRLGTSLQTFMETLGITMGHDHIKFNEGLQGVGDVRNNATHEWKLWVDACNDGADNWAVKSSFQKYEFRHYDRMLITYAPKGATPDDQLKTETNTIPTVAQLDADRLGGCHNSLSA